MIKIEQLTMEFDERSIFENLNLEIGHGLRLGIVGNNGSGKTTLVRLIAGQLEATRGKVHLGIDDIIGMMPQVNYVEGEENLSGGERTKKAILKVFQDYSNILILDEPTNHLDLKGIKWLKNLIDDYYGTVIIISHDRYFMDLVCDGIYELDNGRGTYFKGNYTDYRVEKAHRYQSHIHAYEKQEAMKVEIQASIGSLKNWSEKGYRESTKKLGKDGAKMGSKEKYRKRAEKKDRMIKSRIKRLEKIDLEGVKRPEEELEIKFTFGDNKTRIKRIFNTEDLVMGFNEKTLFTCDNMVVQRGERIGIVGANGSGKTTFIRLLQGQLEPVKGRIYMNPSLNIGYLSQEVVDLNDELTILQSLGYNHKSQLTIGRIQLNNLGLGKDMVCKKIKTLSMGERTRVKLAKIILENSDVLILDEPTNHLDIHTRETLEKALRVFEGTLIVVSHDYYMLQEVCNDTIEIVDGKMRKLGIPVKGWLKDKGVAD